MTDQVIICDRIPVAAVIWKVIQQTISSLFSSIKCHFKVIESVITCTLPELLHYYVTTISKVLMNSSVVRAGAT